MWSCQDEYQLVTMHMHSNFMVLPQWETDHDLISHSVALCWHWANQSLPYPYNAEHLAWKCQVSIFKLLIWLNWEPNTQSPALEVRALPIRPPRPVTQDSSKGWGCRGQELINSQPTYLIHKSCYHFAPLDWWWLNFVETFCHALVLLM